AATNARGQGLRLEVADGGLAWLLLGHGIATALQEVPPFVCRELQRVAITDVQGQGYFGLCPEQEPGLCSLCLGATYSILTREGLEHGRRQLALKTWHRAKLCPFISQPV